MWHCKAMINPADEAVRYDKTWSRDWLIIEITKYKVNMFIILSFSIKHALEIAISNVAVFSLYLFLHLWPNRVFFKGN